LRVNPYVVGKVNVKLESSGSNILTPASTTKENEKKDQKAELYWSKQLIMNNSAHVTSSFDR